MTLKSELLTAAEDAIAAYRRPDGSAWKVGERLSSKDARDFRWFITRSIKAAIKGSGVSCKPIDEQTLQITVWQGGDKASTVYKWELGGFFDLNDDGEMG